MTKIAFNDDNTKKGVEGWYAVKDDILIVYVKATNSREDWVSNFLAFPVYSGIADCFLHLGLQGYGLWMSLKINDLIHETGVSSVYLFGYSMGGGVAQIAGEYDLMLRPYKIISIDGPRTTSKITSDCTLYYNRGSLVNRIPPWFKRMKNTVCLNDKWRPFWKAHADYDIDGIIKGELKS